MAEPSGRSERQSQSQRQDAIKLFRSRTERARAIRDDWQTKYKLKDLYEAFLGDDDVAFGALRNEFAVNRFLPTIKTLLPTLFLHNPTFVVRSKDESQNPDSLLMAQMSEAMLRAIAEQEHHLELSVKLALLQSFFSIGVVKPVYSPALKPNPRKGEPIFATARGLPALDGATGELEVLTDENGDPVLEPNDIVDDEVYRWDWVNGDKMLLPDAGPNHLRWPWIAEEVTVLLSEAKKDQRFPSNLRTQFKANVDSSRISGTADFMGQDFFDTTESDTRDEFFTYIELWDIREKRYQVWADGQGFSNNHFLVNRTYPRGVDRHPYALLMGYTPILAPKPSPWPLPHTWSWLGGQQEYSDRRMQGSIAAKRSARKVYYDQSTFAEPEEAVAALQSSEDMQAVMVSSIDQTPKVQADPPPPGNIAQDLQFLDADWVKVTGVGLSQSRLTATQANIEEAAGEAREIDMRHAVNTWLTVAGEKMFQLVQATLTLGIYIRMRSATDTLFLNYISRVYGAEVARNLQNFPDLRRTFDQQFGNERWQVITREQLEFQADISVAPGSARPRNMANEKRDFMEFMTILGQVPVLAQSRALMLQAANMFDFINPAMIDEILAASQRAQQIEAIQAGRLQGSDNQPAANGGGANLQSFQRAFVGG